jgi:hypothetical protein
MFLGVPNTWKTKGSESGLYGGGEVGGGAKKWLQELDVSFYRQGSEYLIVCYDRCLKKFVNYVQK